MAPAIHIIAALGEGCFGVVFEAQIDGAEYAIKMFRHNEREALENECRAYHAISTVSSLRSRICRLEGLVDDLPNHYNYQLLPVLQLQRLHGDNLAMVITKLSKPKRDELRDHLHHTLDILHNDAKLAHGDIKPNNIILEGNFPVLIDFSNAVFKSELNDKLWYSETCHDRDSLNEMFDRVDSSEATTMIIKRLGNLGPDVPGRDVQHVLASLLSTSRWISPEHIRDLQQAVPSPIPALSLHMATHLASKGQRHDAFSLIMQAIDHEERYPTPDLSDVSSTMCLMKQKAAYLAEEHHAVAGETMGPGALQLYRDAIEASYLHHGSSDFDLLNLRLDYVCFLRYHVSPEAAFQEFCDIFNAMDESIGHAYLASWLANTLKNGVIYELQDEEMISRAEDLWSKAQALAGGIS